MNHSPNLLLHNNGVYFSLAATQDPRPLWYTSLNTSRNLLFTHRQRAGSLFPLIRHGVGKRGQSIVWDLPRAGHSLPFSHGTAASHRKHGRRSTPTHSKPASLGHTKAKKRMETQKEAEIEEALSKRAPANPSENCIARLFEQQPIRLQNSNATFHCTPQEANTLKHKASRMGREKFFLYTSESSKVKSFNGDAKLNPDFSEKLLDILSSFKRNNQFSDVKSTGVTDSQSVKNTFGEDVMQRHPQSNVFVSFESQKEAAVQMERQSRIVDETSIEGTQLAAPNERSCCGMLDSSSEGFLDSPLVCKGPQDNQPAFEESGFSSESSDDDNYKEENRQASDELENVSLQHAIGPFEDNGRRLSDSAPVSSGKRWSHVSPWHLSRSTGSRSSPSRSSIPGLRSKYSKPDPKAKQQLKIPLQLLANFEEETELINRSVLEGEDEEDDVTLQTFRKGFKQPAIELKEHVSFDWWDSDEDEDLKCRLSSSSKSPTGSKVESSMNNSKVEIKSRNLLQLKGEAEGSGSLMSFEWSDLDEEDDLKIKENSMFEWSDSDAEGNSDAEEKSFFKWKDEDAEHDFGTENATPQNQISFEIEGKSTWPNKSVARINLSSSSDQAMTRHNQAAYQDSGLHTNYNREFSVEATEKLNNDGLHELPASVKFVEAPLWKSPIFPDFPFEINYSYSEIPKAPVLGFRDHLSPFTPKTLERPWTGGAHKKPRRHAKAIESFNRALERKKTFELTFNRKSKASKQVKSREEILGKPLTKDEIISLVQNCHEENRQVNLGRDGLTHNMIHLIHTHWKRRPVCKIKCRGVSTLDMDNVCFHVEDKTGGQIIYRSGGTVYVFRGRNYIYEDRPLVPFMLFRPSSPVYPKLVPQAPAGLTIDEAHQLRILSQKVKPLLKLRKNAVLLDLVRDVRDAFQVDNLVSLDYARVKQSDYRQIGAKLMELVPCVLLSFRNNRIVLWKGRDLKLPSVIVPQTCPDGARLDGDPADLEGSRSLDDGFSCSEPDVQSVDVSTLPVSKKKSTQLHQSDVCESDLMDSLDVISEHWHTKIESHKAAEKNNLSGGTTRGEMSQEPQFLGGIKAPSDVPTMSDDLVVSWTEQAGLCAGGEGITSALSDVSVPVYETANCSGDDSTLSVRSARWDHLDEVDQSRLPPSRLDDLWELALNNGLAVEIKGVDLEADLILHKVTHFSEVAHAGPVYTDRLVNRLRLFGLYKKTQKRFVVPLHVIRRKDRVIRNKNQRIKNRVAKQASRSPKIEMPPRKVLRTEDLVKKLQCI